MTVYQRAELHNHSTESDGSMTVEELMRWAAEKNYEVAALTDHNTASGHEKAEAVIRREGLDVSLLKGIEATTFYGHILALGTSSMADLRGLNPQAPEGFIRQLKANGAAAVGIAHPKCLGRPVMAGCRFDMDLRDWDAIDYIEVFNTSAGTGKVQEELMGNEKALELWEEKVLEGHHLAAVTGKDIHEKPADLPVMITYAAVEEKTLEKTGRAQAVLGAILEGRTIVTKGPLLTATVTGEKLEIEFDHSSSYLNWKDRWKDVRAVLSVRDNLGKHSEYPADFQKGKMCVPADPEASVMVLRLYEESSRSLDSLLAAGVAVWRGKEEEA